MCLVCQIFRGCGVDLATWPLTKLFLRQYGHNTGGKIRCDQGGELARSEEWRSLVLKEFQYYVEPTGADSPSQNGQVENYNKTLGTIVRTLLYGSQLPAKYWSAAATHAVYLMNRRYHSTIFGFFNNNN